MELVRFEYHLGISCYFVLQIQALIGDGAEVHFLKKQRESKQTSMCGPLFPCTKISEAVLLSCICLA